MTYFRSGGQVLEFRGKGKRLNVNPPQPLKEDEDIPLHPEEPASIRVQVVGAVLRRISRWVRERCGVEIVLAQASFREDGYAFWTSFTKDGKQWMYLFSEEPNGKFKVSR